MSKFSEKRFKLLLERALELENKKEILNNLRKLNQKATPGPWIPLDLGQALKKNEDIVLLVELRNNAEMLINDSESRTHTEEWYSVRFELLRQLCEEHGFLTEYCNIAANGMKDIHSPPTYQQQMALLKYELEKTKEKAKFWQDKFDQLQLSSLDKK